MLQQSIGLIDNYHVRGTFGEGIVEESTECRMIVKLDNICYRFSCNYDGIIPLKAYLYQTINVSCVL